jgi:hypothetical protein
MVSRNIPNSEQDALSFMVARTILMGLAKITKGDGAIDGRYNVGETNVAWSFGQHVTAANSAL